MTFLFLPPDMGFELYDDTLEDKHEAIFLGADVSGELRSLDEDIETNESTREEFKADLEEFLAYKKLILDEPQWEKLSELYTLYDANKIDLTGHPLLYMIYRYAYGDGKQQAVFSKNITTLFSNLENCKLTFPEARLEEVILLEEQYGSDIYDGKSGFPFGLLGACKSLWGDEFDREMVQKLTSGFEKKFPFQAYIEAGKTDRGKDIGPINLIKRLTPINDLYWEDEILSLFRVKKIWGNLIPISTIVENSEISYRDFNMLSKIGEQILGEGLSLPVISTQVRDLFKEDTLLYESDLLYLISPLTADGLPRKLADMKDVIDTSYSIPGVVMNFNMDETYVSSFSEEELAGFFTYIEKKGRLPNIATIFLYDKNISSFPEQFVFPNVTALNLGGNDLKELPSNIGTLFPHLTSLHVTGNNLVSLPSSLSSLQLEELDIGSNDFSEFPKVITSLTSLKMFRCSMNKIKQLPPEIIKLQQLEEIYLLSNGLTLFPKEITGLPLLQEVNVGWNDISMIPAEIGNLSLLRTLDLKGNKLEQLPDTLKDLSSLQQLDVSNNQFQDIPSVVLGMNSLTDMDLGNNPISSVPPELAKLQNLQYLSLHDTKISSWPEEMQLMKKLSWINVSDTGLTSFPEYFNRLPNLTYIFVRVPVIQEIDQFPYQTTRCKFTKDVVVSDEVDYLYFSNRKDTKRIYDEFRRIDGIDELKHMLQRSEGKKTLTEGYSLIARYNQNIFIRLLDDSRKAHSNNPESTSVFSKQEIGTRKGILSGPSFDSDLLTHLLIYGGQELQGSYESNFKEILHAWFSKKDFLEILTTKSGQELRMLLSTGVQLAGRYLHYWGNVYPTFLTTISGYILKNETTKQELYAYMRDESIVDHLLPIISEFEKCKDIRIKKPVLELLKNTVPEFKKIRAETNMPEGKRVYHTAGLLLNLYEGIGIPCGLSPDEKKTYELSSLHDMQSLEVTKRNEKKPCMLRMFFDYDADGRESYKHWFMLMQKNELFAFEDLENGIVHVKIKDIKGAVVGHMLVNNPNVGERVANDELNEYIQQSFPGKYPSTDDITYDIVIDRGHAGNEDDGLQAISASTTLCLIGSCGGYTHINKALEENSHLQYIGTSGTGHKAVNDAFILGILEALSLKQNVERKNRSPPQQYMVPLAEYKANRTSYSLPDQNIVVAFKQSLDDLLKS